MVTPLSSKTRLHSACAIGCWRKREKAGKHARLSVSDVMSEGGNVGALTQHLEAHPGQRRRSDSEISQMQQFLPNFWASKLNERVFDIAASGLVARLLRIDVGLWQGHSFWLREWWRKE